MNFNLPTKRSLAGVALLGLALALLPGCVVVARGPRHPPPPPPVVRADVIIH